MPHHIKASPYSSLRVIYTKKPIIQRKIVLNITKTSDDKLALNKALTSSLPIPFTSKNITTRGLNNYLGCFNSFAKTKVPKQIHNIGISGNNNDIENLPNIFNLTYHSLDTTPPFLGC